MNYWGKRQQTIYKYHTYIHLFQKGRQTDRTLDIGHTKTKMDCGYYKYKSTQSNKAKHEHYRKNVFWQ
jgi:hypothetical protein